MSRSKRILWAVFGLALVMALNPQGVSAAEDQLSDQKLEKLNAFARTYGYVRFFHPSDQASLLDWNQMAIFGAHEVLNSPDSEATEHVLDRIFSPVVVDLDLYRGEAKPKPETKKVPVRDLLAWQHSGVGLGLPTMKMMYQSARTNRAIVEKVEAAPFANVLQAMDANELRGKEVRFRFKAKVDQKGSQLQGWFRVDRESEEKGLFGNMRDQPITKMEWTEYELSGTVDDDAELITFGVMMFEKGSGLIDDAKFEIKDGDEWDVFEIRNADFEDGDTSPRGWLGVANGYDYVTETEDVAEGDKAMRIVAQSSARATPSTSIFDRLPELGEVVDAEIGDGLRVRMPLAMAADNRYEPGDDQKVDAFVKRVQDFSSEEHEVIATANIAISWSIFQHFYPYFDQIETDWDEVLVTSMKSAAAVKDRDSATRSLKWLVAKLHDGHGNVIDPRSYRGMKFLPVSFDWVEDQLVVVASRDESMKVGGVVTHIDGVTAKQRLENDETLISGSPQWKRYRSVSAISQVSGSVETVSLRLKRDGKEWEVSLAPESSRPPVPEKLPVIDTIEEGEEDGTGTVYYVDLGRAETKGVDPMIEKFVFAKGIVFDVRGYPRGTQYLFQHITDEHLQSAKWLVADQVRPDRVDMKTFDERGRWQMPPREPRFKGKVVFITDGSAISYAESCMAIIANHKLAPIVGSPTAGANGNINPFTLPGGYRVIYTGMRVINHDDSQHHVFGVQPTVPLKPTVQGIRDGRDELLEKAIEILNQ